MHSGYIGKKPSQAKSEERSAVKKRKKKQLQPQAATQEPPKTQPVKRVRKSRGEPEEDIDRQMELPTTPT